MSATLFVARDLVHILFFDCVLHLNNADGPLTSTVGDLEHWVTRNSFRLSRIKP